MIMISNFLFNFTNVCVIDSFFLTLLKLDILFSAAIRAVVVAKLVILGISLLTSFILALRAAVAAKLVILCISPLISFILALKIVLVAKLVISGILSSIFLILALYNLSYKIIFATLISLLKSWTWTGTNLS